MEVHKSSLKIGEVARKAGVSVDALRFYEERGVIPRASRSEGGYRMFPSDTPERLEFVARAKTLGFSLDDIVELLSLRSSGAKDSHRVLEKVRERIQEVDHRLGELGKLRLALVSLASTCDGNHPTSECPILSAFTGEKEGGHGCH